MTGHGSTGSTAAGNRVLVIEDEASIRDTIAVNLRAWGYVVELAANGADGIASGTADKNDVILLDLGLPDMDGVRVINEIRSSSDVPIIVLSVRGEEADKVVALDAGADDYVTKPFGMGEVLARMRAVARRQSEQVASTVRTGYFELDLAAHRAKINEVEIRLTPIEWGLAKALATRPGRLVPRRELLQEVWGPEYGNETNYLRVHLANLRHKLEPDPSNPIYFITEPGIGYRFEPDQ